jgi:hypothetical protein
LRNSSTATVSTSTVLEDFNGWSTRFADSMPMSADILRIENFLQPENLIVVDGRTANARFLKTNLRKNWGHHYFKLFDQDVFELNERPLGHINKNYMISRICESIFKGYKILFT